MKKLISILICVSMFFSLTACSATEQTQPTATGEPIEVVWWTYYATTNLSYLQTIIDAFNESQNEYHVSIVYQGNQAEVNAKLASTAKEDLHALFNGSVENAAMYAGAEFCSGLQSYIDADEEGWPELEDTWDSLRAAYTDVQGDLLGYPCGYSYPGIFYNADLLEKAGIDPAELLSMNDLYEASKKLVDGGYCTYGIGFHADGYYPSAMLGREGLTAYNNQNGRSTDPITQCLYTSDEAVYAALSEMLTVYQKLHTENLCIPYGSDYQADVIPQIASGDCALFLGVVSMTTKILTAVDGKFEVGIIPLVSCTDEGKRTGEPAGGSGIFIGNNGSPAQMQGAYEFIKFLSQGECSAYFAASTGYLAPSRQAYESEVYQDFITNTWPAATTIYESLAASDDSASLPYIPISNEIKAAHTLMIESTCVPNANIAEIIQTANDSIQEAIELYNMSNG